MRALCLTLTILAACGWCAADESADRFAVHTWNVDDATRGLLIRDDRAPVVALTVQFPAGTWSRWAEQADLSTAMAIQKYDPRGTLRRRADELSVQVQVGASNRVSRLSLWCLKEDLPAVLELVRDVLGNDDFDRKELKRWKRGRRISWRASQKDVQFRARQMAARGLYREGDPRRKGYDGPREMETDPRKLREIRDRIVRLPGRVVAFAGDLEPAEAERAARDLLPAAETDPPVDLEPALLPLRPRDERGDTTTTIPRLTQVYFGLGRVSVSMENPDYPAFVVANHVLGGHFYSRISVALRHEEGDTYGAFASAEGGVVPGPFVVASFTRTDNAPAAEAKMRETLRVFREDGITEQERAEAIGYLLGKAPFARQTPWNVLFRRLNEEVQGLPVGFFDTLPHRAAELSLDEINGFIRRYYDPSGFTLARVAPE
jgi:predicted Zn-dependent peptidase